MKAVVQPAYGSPDLLRFEEVETPAVVDGGALVRVRATSINSGDWRRVFARPFLVRLFSGIRRPRDPRLGGDVAGVVEALGSDVVHLSVGDEVYGLRSGAFAEYVSGQSFVRKPSNLTLIEAAAVPIAGVTALQAVRDHGHVQPGQRVLVNGAGGGVGTFAVQLAKAFGAEVTAVTRTQKLELVRALGADHVVDYTRADFWRGGQQYDVIVDCGGAPTVAAFRRALSPGGILVLVAAGKGAFGSIGRFIGARIRSRLLRQRVVVFIASGPYRENLETLRDLIEAGKVRPVIDRTYSLAQIADAIRYAEAERTCGKIAVTVP